jgi:hypothetical protein
MLEMEEGGREGELRMGVVEVVDRGMDGLGRGEGCSDPCRYVYLYWCVVILD